MRQVLEAHLTADFRYGEPALPQQLAGGIVAFISNGNWIDGNAQDGMRQCLESEFDSIYVLNLRGNCRTSGELRRREGDGIFGLGSHTPIAITFLVRNPAKHNAKAVIRYHVIGDKPLTGTEDDYSFYSIPDKMRFAKTRNENGKSVDDRTKILYNGHISIENIPLEAYDYIVNGKSAIEWLVERYAVTKDTKSLIVNDCNAWAREHARPRYILDLLLSVISLSLRTVALVNSLPTLSA